MYKKAIMLGVRFSSTKGDLMVEDLKELTLIQLNNMAKDLNRQLKQSKEEDFLKETSSEDAIIKLKFDIVIDMLETKKAEKKALEEEKARKERKQKILGLIEKKDEQSLENMSKEDLIKEYEKL